MWSKNNDFLLFCVKTEKIEEFKGLSFNNSISNKNYTNVYQHKLLLSCDRQDTTLFKLLEIANKISLLEYNLDMEYQI